MEFSKLVLQKITDFPNVKNFVFITKYKNSTVEWNKLTSINKITKLIASVLQKTQI